MSVYVICLTFLTLSVICFIISYRVNVPSDYLPQPKPIYVSDSQAIPQFCDRGNNIVKTSRAGFDIKFISMEALFHVLVFLCFA